MVARGWKMKRGIVFFILALFLLNIIAFNFVHSQDEPPMPAGLDPEKIDETKEKIEGKWDYLSRQWKIILLQNKIVKSIDTAFTSIDEKAKIFRILFGIPWNLGLTTIIAILLWLVFLFYSSRQLGDFLEFEKAYCFLLALGLTIVLSQLKLFIIISNEIFSLFTTTSGKIMLMLTFLIVLWLMFFIDKFSSQKKKQREQDKLNETKEEMTRLRTFSERLFSWIRRK